MRSGNYFVRCSYFKVICTTVPHLEETPLPKWAPKELHKQQKMVILDSTHMSKTKSSSAGELHFAYTLLLSDSTYLLVAFTQSQNHRMDWV